MLLVQVAHDMIFQFTDPGLLHHLNQNWLNHTWFDLSWLNPAKLEGQQFDTDVFKGVRTYFNDFLKTGKLWTLLIGIGIGYFVGKLTTYG
jgi:hypothetical protein